MPEQQMRTPLRESPSSICYSNKTYFVFAEPLAQTSRRQRKFVTVKGVQRQAYQRRNELAAWYMWRRGNTVASCHDVNGSVPQLCFVFALLP